MINLLENSSETSKKKNEIEKESNNTKNIKGSWNKNAKTTEKTNKPNKI